MSKAASPPPPPRLTPSLSPANHVPPLIVLPMGALESKVAQLIEAFTQLESPVTPSSGNANAVSPLPPLELATCDDLVYAYSCPRPKNVLSNAPGFCERACCRRKHPYARTTSPSSVDTSSILCALVSLNRTARCPSSNRVLA